MTELTATLPQHWGEVPLLPFCRLLAATDLTQRAAALAQLVGLEPEQLVSNMRLYQCIEADMPFLKELPPGLDALPEIVHGGILYHHVGNLQEITAGQLEALNDFLQAYAEQPVLAGPHLLAVLYKPAGLTALTWDAKAIQAAATAFEVLPVDVAWPALSAFLVATGPLATVFQQYSAAREATHNLLQTIETSLPPLGDSPGWWRKRRDGVTRAWIASARKRLGLS